MKKLASLVFLALLALHSGAVSAQQPVANYAELKAELDMVAGALDKTADTVLFTYVPGQGATFVMTDLSNKPEPYRDAFARAAQFFIPAVTAMPESERVTFAVRCDFINKWELILTLTKADAGNPEAWTWYFSRGD